MKVTLLIPSRHTVVIRILLHILYINLSKSGIFSSQSSSVYILLVLLLLLHLTHSYTLSLSDWYCCNFYCPFLSTYLFHVRLLLLDSGNLILTTYSSVRRSENISSLYYFPLVT